MRFKTHWFLAAWATYWIMGYTWRIWKFVSVVRDVRAIYNICKDLSAQKSVVVKGIWKSEGIEERA